MSIEDGSSGHTPEDDFPEDPDEFARQIYDAPRHGLRRPQPVEPLGQNLAESLAPQTELFKLNPGEVREFTDEESRHYYSQLHHEWDQAVEKSGYSQSSKARLGAFEINGQVTDDENLASIEAGDFMRMLIKLRARPEDLEHTYLTSFGKEDAKRIEELLEKRMMNTIPLRTYDSEGRLQSPLRVVRGVGGKWNESVMGGGFKVPGDNEWLQIWQEYLDDKYREKQEAQVPDQSASAPEPGKSPELSEQPEQYARKDLEKLAEHLQFLDDHDLLKDRVIATEIDKLPEHSQLQAKTRLLAQLFIEAKAGNNPKLYKDVLAKFSQGEQRIISEAVAEEVLYAQRLLAFEGLSDDDKAERKKELNNLLDLAAPIGVERNSVNHEVIRAREDFISEMRGYELGFKDTRYIGRIASNLVEGEMLLDDPIAGDIVHKISRPQVADFLSELERDLGYLKQNTGETEFIENYEKSIRDAAANLLDERFLKDRETLEKLLIEFRDFTAARDGYPGPWQEQTPDFQETIASSAQDHFNEDVGALILEAGLLPDDPRIDRYRKLIGEGRWKWEGVVRELVGHSIYGMHPELKDAWIRYNNELIQSTYPKAEEFYESEDGRETEVLPEPEESGDLVEESFEHIINSVERLNKGEALTRDELVTVLDGILTIQMSGDVDPEILTFLKGVGLHDRVRSWGLSKTLEGIIKDEAPKNNLDVMRYCTQIGIMLGMDETEEYQNLFDILKKRYLKNNQ